MVDCGFGVERMTADSSSGDFRETEQGVPRKRKSTLADFDSESDDDGKSIKTEPDGKGSGSRPSNHSAIEKRRRDIMNLYITEISALVPMCAAMSRKLDKLTVLRLAVQHIKTLRGCNQSYGKGIYRPGCVSEEELSELLHKSSDGFLLIISCERGRIMHVSEGVEQTLGWNPDDLVSRSCFDLIKKEDARKLKEQMLTSTISETADHLEASESVSSSTSGLNGTLSCFCPGAKRMFYCRMKKNSVSNPTKDRSPAQGGDYVTVRCTGFLKFWPPPLNSSAPQDLPSTTSDSESSNFTSLVLHVSPHTPKTESEDPVVLNCRLSLDGRIQSFDQSVSSVLGYLAEEVVGWSYYDLLHQDDLMFVSQLHRSALENGGQKDRSGKCYRVKGRAGFVKVTSEWKVFVSPWTGERDFIALKHTTIPQLPGQSNSDSTGISAASSLTTLLNKMPAQASVEGAPESIKIGSGKLGELVMEQTSTKEPSKIGSVTELSVKRETRDNGSSASVTKLSQHRSGVGGNEGVENEGRSGNEEATMSVLMRLLDSSGDIHGQVDYGDIHWPI